MSETPESIIQKQLEAYNAHDVDAFMALHSPDILTMEFPSGTIIDSGREAMRKEVETFFKQEKPHVDIVARIVKGNKVIDHEHGSTKSNPSWHAVAIYEVIDGLIQRVWFVKG